MLFTYDVVFADENRNYVNLKFEMLKNALETKGFKLSKVKTKYMKCNFNDKVSKNKGAIRLDDTKIYKCINFWYLGYIIQDKIELIENATNRIKTSQDK